MQKLICCYTTTLLLFFSTVLIETLVIEAKKITETKVVILGAGAAGISAAKQLTKLGIQDFIILDAQSFVGGRVQHADFGNNQVELGANWIYGKGKNPIYKMALQHGLKTVPNDKTNLAFYDDFGKLSDQNLGKTIYNDFEAIKIQLVDYAEKRMKLQQVDLSSRSALSLIGWKPNTPLKAAVEYFNIDWEFAEPPEMCSLEYATGTVDTVTGTYPFGNEFVVDNRGFNHILKEESKTFLNINDSRLMLNTLVKKVIYNLDKVTVITSSDHVIIADYAICTFSLGVLQSDAVEFDPIFPEWKTESFLSFHMTTYTKIFLKFKYKFWGDWQFALYANNVTQHGGYYTVWQNLNAPGYLLHHGSPPHQFNHHYQHRHHHKDYILMVTTTDKESQRVERMTDSQVKTEITHVLHHMFGDAIPPIEEILVPRWYQDPLFKGSYSNWPIGALKKHHMNMRAPLANRLWFAGEAMSADYYGFLHGAWLEGKSVADSIANCVLSQGKNCTTTGRERYEYVTGCDTFDGQKEKKYKFLLRKQDQ